jgi:hypothetical protein
MIVYDYRSVFGGLLSGIETLSDQIIVYDYRSVFGG